MNQETSNPGPGGQDPITPGAGGGDPGHVPPAAPGNDQATNQWAMFLHFSMLASWIVPLAGIIVPIILWQLKKDELPGIVPHAHVVLNWIITSFVYGLICLVLTIIVIGMFGFLVLAVLTVIYAVVGGIKANNGELWEYPGTIIKVFK